MITWMEKKRFVPAGITILLFFTIFYVSGLSFSGSGAGGQGNLWATIYHISIFFLLAIFLFISCLERRLESKRTALSISLLLIYALLDEAHQYFVPGRFSSLGDVFLDLTGVAFASLIYFIMVFFKIKFPKK